MGGLLPWRRQVLLIWVFFTGLVSVELTVASLQDKTTPGHTRELYQARHLFFDPSQPAYLPRTNEDHKTSTLLRPPILDPHVIPSSRKSTQHDTPLEAKQNPPSPDSQAKGAAGRQDGQVAEPSSEEEAEFSLDQLWVNHPPGNILGGWNPDPPESRKYTLLSAFASLHPFFACLFWPQGAFGIAISHYACISVTRAHVTRPYGL